MKSLLAGLVGLLAALPVRAAQQEPTKVPPGTPVTITVSPAAPSTPPVSITLRGRHGHVTPLRDGHTHTGSGYIDVAQPSPDTVVITMTGVAVAYGGCGSDAHASMDFNLEQCFDVNFDKEDLKKAKITIEGRVIGLLRSPSPCLSKAGCGVAEESHACARILACSEAGPGELLGLCLPDHAVSCDNLSINDHDGPVEAPVVAGKYILQQTFHISAQHPKSYLPCKADSAEFAPDPALDPLWISYWEPFHGVTKKDLGFQITIKVAEDTSKTNGDKKDEEKKGEEKKDEEKKGEEKKDEKKDDKKAPEPVGAPAPVGAGTPMTPGVLVPAAPVSLPRSDTLGAPVAEPRPGQ